MKIYAYTITRANSPSRSKLLLETLTQGRDTSGYPFTWHVEINGRGIMGQSMVESCFTSQIVDSFRINEYNEGQHPPTNRAITEALTNGYDYLLRIDDDVEWLSKRWLAKLIESSVKLKDKLVLSPQVKGLRWQPPQSQLLEVEGVPLKIIEGPIGGICRLTPTNLLKEKPYISDIRFPMGGGDASGVGHWATKVAPITPMAYCQHIRIRHAKSTDGQITEDKKHFDTHDMFQHIPYIPKWVP